MVNHFSEQNRRNLGIVWLIVGVVFILSGFSGGFIFILLGILWLVTSDGKGLALFRNEPASMQNLLQRATIGLLVLASVILVANAIP